MPFLHRGRANLLCIVPILIYVLPNKHPTFCKRLFEVPPFLIATNGSVLYLMLSKSKAQKKQDSVRNKKPNTGAVLHTLSWWDRKSTSLGASLGYRVRSCLKKQIALGRTMRDTFQHSLSSQNSKSTPDSTSERFLFTEYVLAAVGDSCVEKDAVWGILRRPSTGCNFRQSTGNLGTYLSAGKRGPLYLVCYHISLNLVHTCFSDGQK